MNDNNTKNITEKNMVILKDLPSNIAKEAYIVLKPNIKIKNKEESIKNQRGEKWPGYIVKEAESVIDNYLSSIEENKNKFNGSEVQKLKTKYKKLKKICIGLGFCLILNLVLQILL